MEKNNSLIIYDSDCAFCTWSVLFVLKRKRGSQYRFTSLTSQTAAAFFAHHNLTDTEMIWLVDEDTYYYKSAATLRIIGRLGGIYRLAYLGLLAPRPIRDWCYGFIAQRRKQLVKDNVCPVIPEEFVYQFID